MDLLYRTWRALLKKYGLASPPVVYHLDTAVKSGQRTNLAVEQDPWEYIVYELHSFIAESRKKICICSMTPEYRGFC